MSQNLITVVGAGKGMGISIARVFGRHDFKVALIARNRKNLEALASTLRAESGRWRSCSTVSSSRPVYTSASST